MEQGERLFYGSSFGAAATACAEHRPDYARDAVCWELERSSGPRVLAGCVGGRGAGRQCDALVRHGRCGREIARVLVPDGNLAGLWNVFDDRVEWVAELERVGGSAAIGLRDTLSCWRAETAEAHRPTTVGPVARFGAPEQAEFPHGQRRTAGSSSPRSRRRRGC